MTPPLVTLDEIRAAAKNIAGSAVRTPLLPCLWADGLYLKPENLQPVGAFKIRGAAQALASLPAEVRAAGVVTESSGNHGQALAYAGRRLGAPVVVVMPDVTVPSKIEATRLYGAEVMLVPAAERSSQRDRIARERGLTYVPPYDSPDIIAGQGTIGLEVFEDLSDADNVVVPVGGGGREPGRRRGADLADRADLPDRRRRAAYPSVGAHPRAPAGLSRGHRDRDRRGDPLDRRGAGPFGPDRGRAQRRRGGSRVPAPP